MIASTPKPPYYAVIFSSIKSLNDEGYATAASRMMELAAKQKGFLGVESVRDGLGITVSYWENLESIKIWKQNSEHLDAQRDGKSKWYSAFKVRISKVEHDYDMV